MKKDMIFFSADNNGLTSTSANHIANLAKEMVREIETSLSGLTLYSTSVALIGTENNNTLTEGDTVDTLNTVQSQLHSVARANALIAWLREAIKAKERLLKETEELSTEAYMKLQGIEKPVIPEMAKTLTEDEYYANMSVNERNRYYSLEALASVLGKAIHPNGAVAVARERLNERIKEPKSIEGNGRDALICTYTPTVEIQEVDDVYFSLQKEFREVQASLNSIKFDCQKAVKESEIEAQTTYLDEYAKYEGERLRIQNEKSAYIKKQTREIGNYKILIPESLKEIYDKVTHLGKK